MKQYIQIAILMNKTKYTLEEVYDYLNDSDSLTEKQIERLKKAQDQMMNTKRTSLAREYKMFAEMIYAMDECSFGEDHPEIYKDAKDYLKDLEDAILSECSHCNAKELQGITWKEVLDGTKKDVVINYYLNKHRVKLNKHV